MEYEKIKVKATESGKTMEVVVVSKWVDRIQVAIGEGVHSTACDMTPIRSKRAYVGEVMGREIVYERSCDEVQADLDKDNLALRKSRRF